jgi:hypothetical protein
LAYRLSGCGGGGEGGRSAICRRSALVRCRAHGGDDFLHSRHADNLGPPIGPAGPPVTGGQDLRLPIHHSQGSASGVHPVEPSIPYRRETESGPSKRAFVTSLVERSSEGGGARAYFTVGGGGGGGDSCGGDSGSGGDGGGGGGDGGDGGCIGGGGGSGSNSGSNIGGVHAEDDLLQVHASGGGSQFEGCALLSLPSTQHCARAAPPAL